MEAEVTESHQKILHDFYIAARQLLQSGLVPQMCVQRSFEEAISGFLGSKNWRPSHISPAAAREILKGCKNNVQRAHGVLGDRMDRFDRTIEILEGDVRTFSEWWDFYTKNDLTVLITKDEHSSNKKFVESDLIVVPTERELFLNSGFSFKVRKRVEIAWISLALEDV
jgi:hypothetical protein